MYVILFLQHVGLGSNKKTVQKVFVMKVQMQTKKRVEEIDNRSSMIEKVDQDELGDGDSECHMRASIYYTYSYLLIYYYYYYYNIIIKYD